MIPSIQKCILTKYPATKIHRVRTFLKSHQFGEFRLDTYQDAEYTDWYISIDAIEEDWLVFILKYGPELDGIAMAPRWQMFEIPPPPPPRQ